MAKKIAKPTFIEGAGNQPKIIEEFVGNINTKTSKISIARMKSPGGWVEPGQTPEFDEYTFVIRGELHVKTTQSTLVVKEGETVVAEAGDWVQYSTPNPGGAEYIAICVPAFSPELVNRDE